MLQITFIDILLLVTLGSAFCILLIDKIGLRNRIIEVAPNIISRLFSCDFCLSFWTSLIIAIGFAILFSNIQIILIPIFSAPLTRFLL